MSLLIPKRPAQKVEIPAATVTAQGMRVLISGIPDMTVTITEHKSTSVQRRERYFDNLLELSSNARSLDLGKIGQIVLPAVQRSLRLPWQAIVTV